ncbi:hypothetical protein BOX15_Mlig026852g1 [Macrostomum lignano]|uniref:SHSP domain-containing protein n=1 Tax=Macrostomum lignano TaxID=282301 RepID=A0A267H0K8_9PLAT|nr:hypothetical protein BOX15_Mlig026852g1 [Macrostomum lignano]
MASKTVSATSSAAHATIADEMRQFLTESRRQRMQHRLFSQLGDEGNGDLADEGETLTTCCHMVGSSGVYQAAVRLGEDFSPDEARVRVDAASCSLLVEAEHREERPGKKIQRRLQRSFQPPRGTDLERLSTRFDGQLLLLEAPFSASSSGASCGCKVAGSCTGN